MSEEVSACKVLKASFTVSIVLQLKIVSPLTTPGCRASISRLISLSLVETPPKLENLSLSDKTI